MGEMAKFPYLTNRRGSENLCYKRMVPLDLRCKGRPAQIWRSLGTPNRKAAERAYAAKHAEVEGRTGRKHFRSATIAAIFLESRIRAFYPR